MGIKFSEKLEFYYDLIFIDEAQDFDPIMLKILLNYNPVAFRITVTFECGDTVASLLAIFYLQYK